MSIAFIDLQAQRRRISGKIDAAVKKTIEGGAYIMGPEVTEFEKQLSAFSGAKRTISCANGTDALVLPLMAWGVGEGDAVFCPSFTFAATAEIVPWIGASPVFVDILPDTYNMDPAHLDAAIKAGPKAKASSSRKSSSPSTCSASRPTIRRSPRSRSSYGLKLIADSAQGFGCTLDGKHPDRNGPTASPPASSRQSRLAAMATAARSRPTTRTSAT